MKKFRKYGYWLYLSFIVVISALILLVNFCLWTVSAQAYTAGQSTPDARSQLQNIKRRLQKGEGMKAYAVG